jgi:UDP-glucose 4-epimerase
MTIFGDGTQTRAFSYIGDVAPLIAESIELPAAQNQVFNVGADEPTSLNDLAALVASAMGKPAAISYLDARDEVLHAVADHSKIDGVFGRRSKRPLAEGIQRMADWAARAGPREPSRRSDIEVRTNLPPSWREGPTNP